jgi:Holliday junction DNA helicase RuvA
MIGYLSGKLIDKTENTATILTGGVGYEVFMPTSELSKQKVEDDIDLFIYTHVREDILALYGFAGKDEMSFFKQLLLVSGIGPKVALSIVASAPISKLKNAISQGDPTIFAAVSGVGKKTAEKAVIELRGKLGIINSGDLNFVGDEVDEVYEALMSLGFQKPEISDALQRLDNDILGSEAKIKAVIKMIGKK